MSTMREEHIIGGEYIPIVLWEFYVRHLRSNFEIVKFYRQFNNRIIFCDALGM